MRRLVNFGLGLFFMAGLSYGSAVGQTPSGQKAKTGTASGQTQAGQQHQFDADRFIKDHDKNKDGKLSKDELPPSAQNDFTDIDTNKDGFITVDELRQHAQKMAQQRPQLLEIVWYAVDVPEEPMTGKEIQDAYDELKKIDKNHDGKIDSSELNAFRAERRKERVDSIFTTLDTNKDGKLSKDEARGFWADDFSKLDTNKDGFLERNEVEAALSSGHQAGKAHTSTNVPATSAQAGQK